MTSVSPRLTCDSSADTFQLTIRGGLAQLGERLHGMQEVSGSSPLSSTEPGSSSSPDMSRGFFRARVSRRLVGDGANIPLRGRAVNGPLHRRECYGWRGRPAIYGFSRLLTATQLLPKGAISLSGCHPLVKWGLNLRRGGDWGDGVSQWCKGTLTPALSPRERKRLGTAA